MLGTKFMFLLPRSRSQLKIIDLALTSGVSAITKKMKMGINQILQKAKTFNEKVPTTKVKITVKVYVFVVYKVRVCGNLKTAEEN